MSNDLLRVRIKELESGFAVATSMGIELKAACTAKDKELECIRANWVLKCAQRDERIAELEAQIETTIGNWRKDNAILTGRIGELEEQAQLSLARATRITELELGCLYRDQRILQLEAACRLALDWASGSDMNHASSFEQWDEVVAPALEAALKKAKA